jgi:hypothetical protein
MLFRDSETERGGQTGLGVRVASFGRANCGALDAAAPAAHLCLCLLKPQRRSMCLLQAPIASTAM